MRDVVNRVMRWLLAGLIVFTLDGPAPSAASELEIEATRIALNPESAADVRAGAMIWRGGLELRADHPRFGGFSGLETADNGNLVAVSDLGWRLDLHPMIGDTGNLAGVELLGFGSFVDSAGNEMLEKVNIDAEALARTPDGRMLIAFERRHRIASIGGRRITKSLVVPDSLPDAPFNGGIEAMTVLADGRILALAERMRAAKDDGGSVAGWIGRSGDWRRIAYPVSFGYMPTGAATLPNGDILVLERHYTPLTGVAARIRKIPAAALQDSSISGPIIMELQPPRSVDNMEGIAIGERNGATIVYLVSDDNLNRGKQRTLLMMFELDE